MKITNRQQLTHTVKQKTKNLYHYCLKIYDKDSLEQLIQLTLD